LRPIRFKPRSVARSPVALQYGGTSWMTIAPPPRIGRLADADELMDRDETADDHVVLDRDVAGERGAVPSTQ